MLTKKQFKKYLDFMVERCDQEKKINEVLSKEFVDLVFYPYILYEEKMVELLRDAMGLSPENDIIEYYCWELDFGRASHAVDCITTDSERKWSLTTPEELWDYIVETKR